MKNTTPTAPRTHADIIDAAWSASWQKKLRPLQWLIYQAAVRAALEGQTIRAPDLAAVCNVNPTSASTALAHLAAFGLLVQTMPSTRSDPARYTLPTPATPMPHASAASAA